LEVIVVDDNSTDATHEIVKQFPCVKYLSLPTDDPHRFNYRGVNINAGWMARNVGIDHAHGEWLTFQDADDASLRNRIEIQLFLAKKYQSRHVCTNWQQFNDVLIGTSFDINTWNKQKQNSFISRSTITALAKKTKGVGFSLFRGLHPYIPFILKKRSSLFFRSWDSYPYAGNSPFVKREVFKHVRFRPRNERVWPSDRGRGADRDFNFQVAETFQDSICINIPLYLWRVKIQNPTLTNLS